MSHHRIDTEIDIAATPERVWSVLTDFEAYPQWNPLIRSIRGVPEPGARLRVRIQPSGAMGMSLSPTVVAAAAGRELRWLGRLLVPGLFDGEHRFAIEPLADGGVRFHHGEQFSGILVRVFRGFIDGPTKRGFEEMNEALRARAEGLGA